MGITLDESGGSTSGEYNTEHLDDNYQEAGDAQTSGDGGYTLDIHTASRMKVLDMLGGRAELDGPLPIPRGIYGNTDGAPSGSTGERKIEDAFMGPTAAALVYTQGEVIEPVEMTAQVRTEGGVSLAADSDEGRILVTADPLADVFSGENGIPYPDMEVALTPPSGVEYSESFTAQYADIGAVEYGTVDGRLQTYRGNPVDGEPIIGDGFSTEAKTGKFEVLAPIGETFDLIVFNGTHEETIHLDDPEQPLTLTYPELVVRVLGPDFSPVEDATVFVDQLMRKTNSAGEARLPKIGVTTVDIEVQGYYHTVENIPEPGISQTVQLTPDSLADWEVDDEQAEAYSALKLLVRDAFTGVPIRNCAVEITGTAIQDTTNMDGLVELMLPHPSQIGDGDDEEGEELIEVVVSTAGDGRYIPETFEIEHPGTEVLELEANLSPTATTTDR